MRTLKKEDKTILTVQMILIIIGLAANIIGLYISFTANTSAYEKETYILTSIAFFSIISYCLVGYRKKDKHYYLWTIYAFTASILCRGIAPYETVHATALYFLIFGLTLVFAERLNKKRDSILVLNAVVVLVAVRTIESLLIYRGFETTNQVQKIFWQFSSLSSLILIVTLAIIHITRWNRGIYANDKA
ncbi:MAG: hypothetical protein IKD62_00095 [Oscillospiraceae bacterium]|nr:hypothetical protein [Oscillospiraceae bacterium]MBR2767841.1 hypothetical protein [Solobacterium sp.]MBR2794427.1 hypothetical protein [Solobacterium sp.]